MVTTGGAGGRLGAFDEHLDPALHGRRGSIAGFSGYAIGAIRLSPVIMQRHDVQVLQLGHQVGFQVKASDEVGLVGEARLDDLNRHLAAHVRLVCPVHRAVCPLPDSLEKFVSLNSELFWYDQISPLNNVLKPN